MAHFWYALYTHHRKEKLVVAQLSTYDIETFLPTIRIARGYGRGSREEPYFPHYVFARLDFDLGMPSRLNRLPGLRTIVCFDKQPAVIADSVIDFLRLRLESAGDKPSTMADWLYQSGDPVRIRRGPFAGLEAVFQKSLNGAERVQVLLEVLGRSSRVQLEVKAIEAL